MMNVLLGSLLLIVLILLLTLFVMAARAILLPSEAVALTVNGTTTVKGTTGEKLLTILNDGRIPVPSACAGAGTCGLCRVTVGAGAGTPLPTETALISRRDIRDGVRLACQIVVRNPLEIGVPSEILSAETWATSVESTTMLAPLIKEIVLKLPEGADFDFHAGAFVQVEAPAFALDFDAIAVAPDHAATWDALGWRALKVKSAAPTTRAYSLANRPEDEGRIVLNIRLAVPPPGADVPPGIVSSYLFGLKAGDSVTVSGPYGHFGVKDTEREMVVIGGGVGMAPLRAIIHEQLARKDKTRKISFWYGARTMADIFYKDEFDQLARDNENFTWTVALSDPARDDAWEGAQGFIHEVVHSTYLADHPAPEDCEYYLCGPPLMIQAVLAMLDDCGVESDTIFNDDFGS